jgi:phosphatidylinositol kinase/protein kinase (PI-3  family)
LIKVSIVNKEKKKIKLLNTNFIYSILNGFFYYSCIYILKGKILPIPETVPFRLTRDLIDGFGICGIEGTFKNSCETILNLLKSSKEQILTIFEVLLYDPLHNWCLSPKKAYKLQQMSEKSDSTNSTSRDNTPKSLFCSTFGKNDNSNSAHSFDISSNFLSFTFTFIT